MPRPRKHLAAVSDAHFLLSATSCTRTNPRLFTWAQRVISWDHSRQTDHLNGRKMFIFLPFCWGQKSSLFCCGCISLSVRLLSVVWRYACWPSLVFDSSRKLTMWNRIRWKSSRQSPTHELLTAGDGSQFSLHARLNGSIFVLIPLTHCQFTQSFCFLNCVHQIFVVVVFFHE